MIKKIISLKKSSYSLAQPLKIDFDTDYESVKEIIILIFKTITRIERRSTSPSSIQFSRRPIFSEIRERFP